MTAVVRLPAVATEPTTVVTALHPSAEVVPENLLRVYIEFSAPMGNGAGLDFVKLVELSGSGGKTERTARTYVSNILGKLGLASRTQAALYAVEHKIAEPATQ